MARVPGHAQKALRQPQYSGLPCPAYRTALESRESALDAFGMCAQRQPQHGAAHFDALHEGNNLLRLEKGLKQLPVECAARQPLGPDAVSDEQHSAAHNEARQTRHLDPVKHRPEPG